MHDFASTPAHPANAANPANGRGKLLPLGSLDDPATWDSLEALQRAAREASALFAAIAANEFLGGPFADWRMAQGVDAIETLADLGHRLTRDAANAALVMEARGAWESSRPAPSTAPAPH